MLEVVTEFCYLGDMLSSGGGCDLAATVRCKTAWGKFRELLPVLTNRHIPLSSRGRVYSTCVRSAMLHGSETWAASSSTINRLRRNDKAMIRWMCGVKPNDDTSSESLLEKLSITDIDSVLCNGRLRWLGHVEPSSGWISQVRKLEIEGRKGKGRPKQTWDAVLQKDRASLGMSLVDPNDRKAWRGRVRSRLSSQATPSE